MHESHKHILTQFTLYLIKHTKDNPAFAISIIKHYTLWKEQRKPVEEKLEETYYLRSEVLEEECRRVKVTVF